MKFLCDRCKTRYSIGDERVRGKILKIRCKNCANVITVREGMPEPAAEAADGDGARRSASARGNHTQSVPIATITSSAAAEPPGPLNAAFASAMTAKAPPPALEEEWYVSIDGDQAGPFSLTEAQQWVAAKPFDAELHCWSEGFDDWLPVDKVSHFRGLRKKPAPAIPPAIPRLPSVGGGAAGANASGAQRTLAGAAAPRLPLQTTATPTPRPEDSKPLFAATLASREKAGAGGLGMAAAGAQPSPYANGRKSLGFDSSELNDVATKEGGFGAPRTPARSGFEPSGTPAPAAEPMPAAVPAAAAPAEPANGIPDHDDIDIGEVSRVVNLADLTRNGGNAPRTNTRRSGPIATTGLAPGTTLGRTTGSVPRPSSKSLNGTGSVTRMSGSVPRMASAPGLAPVPQAGDAGSAPVAAPVVAATHRRAMALLMIAAGLVVGIGVVVVLVVTGGSESSSDRLGAQYELNNERPEIVRRPGDPGPGPVVPEPVKRPPPVYRPPVGPGTRPTEPTAPPSGNSLKAEEIEAMAGKNSTTTQRCWIRSQRGADGITLADVKKITVTLSIGADGTVTGVDLSDGHAQNSLGKCLIASIQTWKFRTSPGGTFRFILHFG